MDVCEIDEDDVFFIFFFIESDDSEIVKKKRTSVNSLMPNEGTRNFGDVFTDPTTNSEVSSTHYININEVLLII